MSDSPPEKEEPADLKYDSQQLNCAFFSNSEDCDLEVIRSVLDCVCNLVCESDTLTDRSDKASSIKPDDFCIKLVEVQKESQLNLNVISSCSPHHEACSSQKDVQKPIKISEPVPPETFKLHGSPKSFPIDMVAQQSCYSGNSTSIETEAHSPSTEMLGKEERTANSLGWEPDALPKAFDPLQSDNTLLPATVSQRTSLESMAVEETTCGQSSEDTSLSSNQPELDQVSSVVEQSQKAEEQPPKAAGDSPELFHPSIVEHQTSSEILHPETLHIYSVSEPQLSKAGLSPELCQTDAETDRSKTLQHLVNEDKSQEAISTDKVSVIPMGLPGSSNSTLNGAEMQHESHHIRGCVQADCEGPQVPEKHDISSIDIEDPKSQEPLIETNLPIELQASSEAAQAKKGEIKFQEESLQVKTDAQPQLTEILGSLELSESKPEESGLIIEYMQSELPAVDQQEPCETKLLIETQSDSLHDQQQTSETVNNNAESQQEPLVQTSVGKKDRPISSQMCNVTEAISKGEIQIPTNTHPNTLNQTTVDDESEQLLADLQEPSETLQIVTEELDPQSGSVVEPQFVSDSCLTSAQDQPEMGPSIVFEQSSSVDITSKDLQQSPKSESITRKVLDDVHQTSVLTNPSSSDLNDFPLKDTTTGVSKQEVDQANPFCSAIIKSTETQSHDLGSHPSEPKLKLTVVHFSPEREDTQDLLNELSHSSSDESSAANEKIKVGQMLRELHQSSVEESLRIEQESATSETRNILAEVTALLTDLCSSVATEAKKTELQGVDDEEDLMSELHGATDAPAVAIPEAVEDDYMSELCGDSHPEPKVDIAAPAPNYVDDVASAEDLLTELAGGGGSGIKSVVSVAPASDDSDVDETDSRLILAVTGTVAEVPEVEVSVSATASAEAVVTSETLMSCTLMPTPQPLTSTPATAAAISEELAASVSNVPGSSTDELMALKRRLEQLEAENRMLKESIQPPVAGDTTVAPASAASATSAASAASTSQQQSTAAGAESSGSPQSFSSYDSGSQQNYIPAGGFLKSLSEIEDTQGNSSGNGNASSSPVIQPQQPQPPLVPATITPSGQIQFILPPGVLPSGFTAAVATPVGASQAPPTQTAVVSAKPPVTKPPAPSKSSSSVASTSGSGSSSSASGGTSAANKRIRTIAPKPIAMRPILPSPKTDMNTKLPPIQLPTTKSNACVPSAANSNAANSLAMKPSASKSKAAVNSGKKAAPAPMATVKSLPVATLQQLPPHSTAMQMGPTGLVAVGTPIGVCGPIGIPMPVNHLPAFATTWTSAGPAAVVFSSGHLSAGSLEGTALPSHDLLAIACQEAGLSLDLDLGSTVMISTSQDGTGMESMGMGNEQQGQVQADESDLGGCLVDPQNASSFLHELGLIQPPTVDDAPVMDVSGLVEQSDAPPSETIIQQQQTSQQPMEQSQQNSWNTTTFDEFNAALNDFNNGGGTGSAHHMAAPPPGKSQTPSKVTSSTVKAGKKSNLESSNKAPKVQQAPPPNPLPPQQQPLPPPPPPAPSPPPPVSTLSAVTPEKKVADKSEKTVKSPPKKTSPTKAKSPVKDKDKLKEKLEQQQRDDLELFKEIIPPKSIIPSRLSDKDEMEEALKGIVGFSSLEDTISGVLKGETPNNADPGTAAPPPVAVTVAAATAIVPTSAPFPAAASLQQLAEIAAAVADSCPVVSIPETSVMPFGDPVATLATEETPLPRPATPLPTPPTPPQQQPTSLAASTADKATNSTASLSTEIPGTSSGLAKNKKSPQTESPTLRATSPIVSSSPAEKMKPDNNKIHNRQQHHQPLKKFKERSPSPPSQQIQKGLATEKLLPSPKSKTVLPSKKSKEDESLLQESSRKIKESEALPLPPENKKKSKEDGVIASNTKSKEVESVQVPSAINKLFKEEEASTECKKKLKESEVSSENKRRSKEGAPQQQQHEGRRISKDETPPSPPVSRNKSKEMKSPHASHQSDKKFKEEVLPTDTNKLSREDKAMPLPHQPENEKLTSTPSGGKQSRHQSHKAQQHQHHHESSNKKSSSRLTAEPVVLLTKISEKDQAQARAATPSSSKRVKSASASLLASLSSLKKKSKCDKKIISVNKHQLLSSMVRETSSTKASSLSSLKSFKPLQYQSSSESSVRRSERSRSATSSAKSSTTLSSPSKEVTNEKSVEAVISASTNKRVSSRIAAKRSSVGTDEAPETASVDTTDESPQPFSSKPIVTSLARTTNSSGTSNSCKTQRKEASNESGERQLSTILYGDQPVTSREKRLSARRARLSELEQQEIEAAVAASAATAAAVAAAAGTAPKPPVSRQAAALLQPSKAPIPAAGETSNATERAPTPTSVPPPSTVSLPLLASPPIEPSFPPNESVSIEVEESIVHSSRRRPSTPPLRGIGDAAEFLWNRAVLEEALDAAMPPHQQQSRRRTPSPLLNFPTPPPPPPPPAAAAA